MREEPETFDFVRYAKMPREERKKCIEYSRNEQFFSLVGTRGVGEDTRQLESARARLKAASFVGLTDHFALSMALLNRHLLRSEMNMYQPYSNANFEEKKTAARFKNEGDEKAVREALEELNHLDSKVYDLAKELFWERVRATWGVAVDKADEVNVAECDPEVVCFDKRLVNAKTIQGLSSSSSLSDDDAFNPFVEDYLKTHGGKIPFWDATLKRYTDLVLGMKKSKVNDDDEEEDGNNNEDDDSSGLDLGWRKKFTACAPRGGCRLL